MKVRLSSRAKAFIAKEGRYLRQVSPQGAKRFSEIVQRARKIIQIFPEGGVTSSAIPLTGARRVSIEGYLFDYDLIEATVWIVGIIASGAVNTIAIEDDSDYEA